MSIAMYLDKGRGVRIDPSAHTPAVFNLDVIVYGHAHLVRDAHAELAGNPSAERRAVLETIHDIADFDRSLLTLHPSDLKWANGRFTYDPGGGPPRKAKANSEVT